MSAELERLVEVSRLASEGRRERDRLLRESVLPLRTLANACGLSAEAVRQIRLKGERK